VSEEVTKTGRLVCKRCGGTDIVAVLTTLVYYAPPEKDMAWLMDGAEVDEGSALDQCSEEGTQADGECLDRSFVCLKCACPVPVVVNESAPALVEVSQA